MILLMISTFDDKIRTENCVDEYIEIFRRCNKSIQLENSSKYHFVTSGKTCGVGLVTKYNVDKDGYSFGPYVCKGSSFTKNHVAESNKIMEYLLNLSLKLSEFFSSNIYRNTTVV